MTETFRRLLERRGIGDVEGFLHPSLKGLADASLLPCADEAADAILSAVAARRRIVVFGDYDCDGICATAILVRTLAALGADVTPFLPRRLSEGYGMGEASVSRMLAENPKVSLVVTVDNGINSVAETKRLKEAGIETVVTDHHLPGAVLPETVVVNPKVGDAGVFSDLCGAGVAFMIASVVMRKAKERGLYGGGSVAGPLLVLAGLATVTDIMPLVGQNRIIVSEALRRFGRCAPEGLRQLAAKAGRPAAFRPVARDFGFLLGPRINAAGRLADAVVALNLVLEDDPSLTSQLAESVDSCNESRKAIEAEMTEKAEALVVEGASAQVLDLPDGHPGIAGIVASRILERTGCAAPVCVIAGGHGSARSPEWLNIREAFEACSECLLSFGGHAAAGGFSVKEGMVGEFRRRLCRYCRERMPEGEAAGEMEADLDVTPDELTLDLVDDLRLLEPCGVGNPEALFRFAAPEVSDARRIGQNGKHLALSLCGMRAVWWNMGGLVDDLCAGARARSAVFSIEASDFGGPHVELRVKAMDLERR